MKKDIEKTFAIIKPDGIKNIVDIISMIYSIGLRIDEYKIATLDEEILREHYAHVVDKPFYPRLEEFMMSGKVVLMILSGENAVVKLRCLMGPTDSKKADKNTIRGKYGTDATINTIHGSDSKENAIIEINRFFKNKVKKKTL